MLAPGDDPMRPRALCPILLLTTLAGGPSLAQGSEELHALFAREWETRLAEDPLFATSVGVHDHDDRLPEMSLEDQARRTELWRGFLRQLEGLDRAALSREDRVHAAVFEMQLRSRVEAFEAGAHFFPFNADSGFHQGMTRLAAMMPMRTTADFENYLARLRALPRWMDQHLATLEVAVERGWTQPAAVLAGYEATISSHVVEDPESSVFFTPLAELPSTVPESEHERLRTAGREAVGSAVVPAYRAFLEFYRERYLPAARREIGASSLPGGEALYRQAIREFTTLDLTPQAIHDIGVAEVARIRAEMDEVLEAVGWTDSFAAFLEHLRTDPRFYAESPRELLERASYIAKKMDGALPALFGLLPRQPYGIEPVPAHIAPKYTAGRYVSATPGSTRPGLYWVNTHDLPSRPLYALPALTLHEAVPGHHLQIALAAELDELPPFRRNDYISAFGEGWGLYSEYLGVEAGIYETPYEDFGRLTYEMWRACRLVVDTGIHALGWSRDRAMEFMASNTALSLHEVETETDRYISWPGQALSYKLGEIEIRKLRGEAEEALGADFDVRGFHDAVLRNGSVPLPILREEIERWIGEQSAGG